MKKSLIAMSFLLCYTAITPVGATNVSNWTELEAAKSDAEITFANDIVASGATSVIKFNSSDDQVLDGNYMSFSSSDTKYNMNVDKTAGNFIFKNFGKFSTVGAGDDSTFSFTDLNGNTVYKKIEKSVNSFERYFLTITNMTGSFDNNVFANNGSEDDARLIEGIFGGNKTVNVTNSIFYNNVTLGAGPVITVSKANLNIENSIFYGNRQAAKSGAPHGGAVKSDTSQKVSINNSYFINSETGGMGGAVYIAKGSGHVIENSRFEGNKSGQEGGGVYVYYNATTDYVKNSQFIGNKQTGSGSYGGGGGLSFGGGYIRTIDNVLFDNNSTTTKGGGLYIEELSSSPSTKKVVLVKDSTLKNNTAELGGGMYFSADYGNNAKHSVRIVDPVFTSNTATNGGGLYVLNGDAAIISENKDVVFSGNSATDTSVSNAGDDIYFKTKSYAASLFLNAAEDKKIVFNGTIATTQTKPANVPVIDINKTGVTYSTYEGETETVHEAGTAGEIQFNNQVGDADGNISNINVYNGTLSFGAAPLYANLDVQGGTVNIANNAATVLTANFAADSTLALTVNSTTDYGSLTAENITVAEGATLKATLAQGIVPSGGTATLQLLSADNEDFNNFQDSFDNNVYHFEKADKNGKYIVTSTSSAEDIVIENGGQQWVADAAKAYVDDNSFPIGTVGADIADKLAALAQNDAVNLISEVKALAPTEMPVIHDYVTNDSSRLFRAVDSYLRGYHDPMGMSAGDTFSDVSIWAKPYYGKSKISSNDVFEKQKSYNKGIIAGIEGKLNPDMKLGFGLHYDETEVDMSRRDLDVDTVSGFVYSEYQINDWFINGLASYGLSDYDEERLALGSRYTSSYDVYTTSLATTVGYQFKYVIPEVGMRYYHIKRDSYTDTAAQNIHKSNANYIRSVAGVRYIQNYGMFSPDVYLGMSYDLKSLKDNTFVTLSNGSSYIVGGEKLPRLGCEFNLGLNTFLNDNIVLGASLMGLYRKDYREYTGVIRLKYDF